MTSDRALSLIAAGLACSIAVATLAGWRAHTQANKHRFAREVFSERGAAPARNPSPWLPARAPFTFQEGRTEASR